jgi:hypothetical protein
VAAIRLVLRKLLASSTFAIAGTLRSLIKRLKDQEARQSLFDEDDLDDIDELTDELEESEEPQSVSKLDRQLLQSELAELERYAELAEGIQHNAKGQALLSVLQTALHQAQSLGAARKAVIFTESRRTQAYGQKHDVVVVIYPDNFREGLDEYLRYSGQVSEEGQKQSTNTETSGRFHSKWLNMMYPRLFLARNLLRDDGVIFVSIDDNEVHNLRGLLNEVFGEENFVAQIVWQRSKKGDSKLIANVHEYIICYVRNKNRVLESGVWRRKKEGVEEVLAQYAQFKRRFKGNHEQIRAAMQEWYRGLSDNDPRKAHKHYNWSDDRGLYFAADFAGPDDGRASRPRHDILHPITNKPCKKPSTGWRWDEAKTKWALEQMPPRIHFGPDETTIPNRKSYLEEIDSEPYPSVFYRDGRSATLEVENLIGKGWFQFPKNTDVMAELIELVTGPEDIVLDYFAGSGTTAHAVLNINQTHGSNRRFVMVQLPEPTEKAAYPTIAHITRERIRQAISKLNESDAGKLDLEGHARQDRGFRAFRLSSSNFKIWDGACAVPLRTRNKSISAHLNFSSEQPRFDFTESDVFKALRSRDL